MAKGRHGTCRLCNRRGRLASSHIIPKMAFRQMKAQDGFFYRIDERGTQDGRLPKMQDGYREYLLCPACEQLIGKHEKVFAESFPHDEQFLPDDATSMEVDYRSIKLTLLATLWRAHEASNPVFESVDLGPWAADIKQMLLNEDPRGDRQFPVFCVLDTSGMARQATSLIERHEAEGNPAYLFPMRGFMWGIYLTDSKETQPLLLETGMLWVPRLDLRKTPWWQTYANMLARLRENEARGR